MDFGWTPEQRTIRKETLEFAQRELADDVVGADREGRFASECWRKCASHGIQGFALPVEYGGQGQDPVSAVAMLEGLGYGCRDTGLIFALSAQSWTVQQSILQFGSDRQKRDYLPGMADGSSIGAYAITEPEAGSDAYSMKARATPAEGGYQLNGEKCFVTLGPVADVVIVFAATDPDAGGWGVSAFLVPTKSAGVEVGKTDPKMGLRTVPFCTLRFQDCFVPAEARLGAEGAGMSISANSLEWERSCMMAGFVGTMERQLDEAIDYAKTRKQFGKAIGKFQSVSNRIAEMKLRLETARLLLYRAAWLKSQGKPVAVHAALAKLHLSQCFVESSIAAIQTQGGRGYLTETGVERDLRDAVGGLLWGGTADVQKEVVARLLGL